LSFATGNKNNIVIQNDNKRLTPEDIERMINDAEKFADEDKVVKEKTEAKNDSSRTSKSPVCSSPPSIPA
jgi:molecular chaperone DnaK (HSP70)